MHTSMPNKKDWGVISLRMIYERVLSRSGMDTRMLRQGQASRIALRHSPLHATRKAFLDN
jgi:hypothetical protein